MQLLAHTAITPFGLLLRLSFQLAGSGGRKQPNNALGYLPLSNQQLRYPLQSKYIVDVSNTRAEQVTWL
ncbi:hypothetical protein [Hymenobacter sp. YC55]|uniref:hypothetical protein n=1 Tax=Hymenobacter sp. YC55 TaxID=3034019 RepID=UPI0023F89102|nr:hypothetical protein [Hymenobacter sp. YC55]MDF7812715.1 hypothetical protein [Hymenobacter sp. YC55]